MKIPKIFCLLALNYELLGMLFSKNFKIAYSKLK